MNVIDFDAEFYKFARRWLAEHPGLTEEQIDESYNPMMGEWLDTPLEVLAGDTPKTYWQRLKTPEEVIDGMRAYAEAHINLPEPLYARGIAMGEAMVSPLIRLLADESADIELRAQAMGMLTDIGTTAADETLIRLIEEDVQDGKLGNMAANQFSTRSDAPVDCLLTDYENAPEGARMRILDICACHPGDERCCRYLIEALRNRPEDRATIAAYMVKLGDANAIDVLKETLGLYDLRYYDYLELRNAVEALGGDPGEERDFYGDPDFEAMRGM